METRGIEETAQLREAIDQILSGMNTCIPGKILAFHGTSVDVQPAIQLRVNLDGKQSFMDLPKIVNAPIVVPGDPVGGFFFTAPVVVGAPCLILFSQRSIDNWFVKGDIAAPENAISARHHSMTDAIVMLAPIPLPNAVLNWQQDGCELRNGLRTSFVKVRDTDVTLFNNGAALTLTGTGLESSEDMTAGTISLMHHTHPDPVSGNTGEPNP